MLGRITAALILASLCSPLRRARACDDETGYYVTVPDEALRVPANGSVVLEALRIDAPGDAVVVVLDLDGSEIAGSARHVELTHQVMLDRGPATWTDELLVWRPDEALAVGASYEILVEHRANGFVRPYQIGIVVTPPTEHELAIPDAEIRSARFGTTRDYEHRCDEPAVEGECPVCEITDEVSGVALQWGVPEDHDDRFTLFRLVPDVGAAIDRHAVAWAAAEARSSILSSTIVFEGEQAEYCAHVEATSLIDGRIVRGESTCVAASDVGSALVLLEPASHATWGCRATPMTQSPRLVWGAVLLGLLAARRRRFVGSGHH